MATGGRNDGAAGALVVGSSSTTVVPTVDVVRCAARALNRDV